MAAITLDIGGNTRQLDRDIQKTVNRVYTINLKTKGDQPLGRITGQVNEFNKSLDASNARVIAFGASAGIIFGVERAFTALVSATIEVQKSLQDINVILNASQANLQKFGAELFNIAKNTGQSFQEVAKAATEFSRQGLGIEETLKRTNEALILSRLSGLDAAKSVESLTAAVNSFASQAVTATEVVNKFATVDAAFAVSSADLADAIARVGSSAAQSGVSLNELIAIVTSAQQTTARGGAVIGNSFKTIFTRLQREKVVDLLESLGISGTDASGQVKSTIQLLQDLGAVYDTLGSQQQAYVAEQVGGVFQINILKAALADLGKEYSIYSSALNVAAGATDQAIRRNEELNKTYSAQINALAENARQLAAAGGERLLGPSIDRLVGGTNTLLEGFSESDGQGVGAVLGKGILDGIGQFIAGPGLALIGGVLLKLFKDLGKFATGSVQQLLGLNTAATQQRDLQQSINQILTKNPQLLQLALKGEQGLNQAANTLLASLQKQTVELQKQAAVAAQISKAFLGAGVRVTGGVPVVPTGRPGKAAGYIPNFAKDDFAREELLATALGAKNPTAQLSKGTIDGRRFIKNNREVEITNFGKNGDSAVIPNYAKGFIPNFQKSAQTPKEIVVAGAKKYGYLIPSTAPGRLSTPDKPIPGGTVTDTANNIKYIFPPQTAYGPKLVEEAEDSNKLENQIYQSVLNRTASYTKRLAPPGKPVSPSDLEKGFQSAKGARGAILSAIGAAFEVGITTALGYEAAGSNVGAGDFDVRSGKGIEKIQSLFGIGGIVKADFKATTGGDSVTSFRKKILREEFGFGGAKKGTGPTGKQLKERGLTSGFRKKAFAGYIPNFAAIQDAVARERAAGIPSGQIYLAQEKALTSANPMGLGVFNKRDEPTKRSRKDAMRRKGFASGYIPNFAIEDPDVEAGNLGSSLAALGAQVTAVGFAFQFSKDEYRQALADFEEKTGKAAKGAQKFGIAAQSNALALSIAAPILGETIKNAFGQETKFGRVAGSAASGIGQVGSFAATGALIAGPGPQALVGAGIGAALGALLTVPDIIKNALTDFPELAKEAQKAQEKLTQFGDASGRLIQAYESYKTTLESGNASAEQLSKVQKSLAEALLSVPAEYRQELTDAVGTGNVAEAAARIQEINAQEVIVKAGVATLEQVSGEAEYTGFMSNLGNTLFNAVSGPLGLINQGIGVANTFAGTNLPTFGSSIFGTPKETLAEEANVENIKNIFEKALIGGDFSTKNLDALKNIKIDTSSIENLRKSLEATGKFKPGQINAIIKQAEIDLTTTGKNVSEAFNGTVTNLEDVIKKNVEAEARIKAYNAAMDESKKRIDATVSSLKTNIEIQNLLKRAFDTTVESLRSLAADINIAKQFTQPAEALGQVIGTDKTPTRKLQAQSDIAVIQEQQRSAISGAGIDFKDTLRGILQKPFEESAAKLLENLSSENLKGDPDKIKTQTDNIIAQTTTEYQNLTSVMQSVEGYMAQFVNGQISTQQLLEQSRAELAGVGIDVSRGSQASDAIEKAVAELEVRTVQEQVKAFQQRAKLASETKQAILQDKINQAIDTFGGFEGFMNRPEEQENYIQRITPDLEKIEEIRGSATFRYNNKESRDEQRKQAPELGRAFANVYKELIGQSGGAFRNVIQKSIDQARQQTGVESRSGKAGASALGGFDDIVQGRATDLEQQLQLAKDQLKVTTDPVLKRDLEGFISEIENLGIDRIAKLQTMQEFGVARQSDFQEIYGEFENQSLERLKEISPELAASLSDAVTFGDPLLAEAQVQSGVQTQILQTIQKAISGQAIGANGMAEPLIDYGELPATDVTPTTKQEIDTKVANIQEQNLPKENRTIAEIEAETTRKRDQKYLTSPLAPLNRTTGKKFESIEQVDSEMTKALALGAMNPEQKEYYNMLKNFKRNLNPTGGADGRRAMFMYDDANPEITRPRIKDESTSNLPKIGDKPTNNLPSLPVSSESMIPWSSITQDIINSIKPSVPGNFPGVPSTPMNFPGTPSGGPMNFPGYIPDLVTAPGITKPGLVMNPGDPRTKPGLEMNPGDPRTKPGLMMDPSIVIQKTISEIEAETRAKRDQKYLTSPLAPLNRTTGKKFGSIKEVDSELNKALALGAVNPEQKEYYDVLKNFKQNLNPVEGTPGRQAMFMYDDMNPQITQPRINQTLQANQQPAAAAQQSFAQQEASFNNNTSALTTLAGGIESLNSTLSNFEANFANLNNVPGGQQAPNAQQGAAQPGVQTTTNAPVNVVVNAQGSNDIAAAVGEAVQNAIPTIIDKVKVALGQKVPPKTSP